MESGGIKFAASPSRWNGIFVHDEPIVPGEKSLHDRLGTADHLIERRECKRCGCASDAVSNVGEKRQPLSVVAGVETAKPRRGIVKVILESIKDVLHSLLSALLHDTFGLHASRWRDSISIGAICPVLSERFGL